jgi:hypothetical protein
LKSKESKVQWSDESDEEVEDDFSNLKLKKRHKSENQLLLNRGKVLSGTISKNGKERTNVLDFICENEELYKEPEDTSPVKRIYKKKHTEKLKKSSSNRNVKKSPLHSPKSKFPKKAKKTRKIKKSKNRV